MKVLTVSDIIGQIKSSLEADFFNITIEGEVSNLSKAASGHCYFSLKDENSMISCAIFRSMVMRNPFMRQIQNGAQVRVVGDISVYNKRGTFQVIIKKVAPLGIGSLKEKFEKLKEKLKQEGLFEGSRKKKIPICPQKIGVVTALGGAALQDFLKIIDKEGYQGHFIISSALVQGVRAVESLIKSLDNLKALGGIDLVVITRGGGSLEDLWSFNEEKLIRYLVTYPLPIISAIGHEIDFTLTDFVADKRLETPSAVASFLSSKQKDMKQTLIHYQEKILYLAENKVKKNHHILLSKKPHQMILLLQRKIYLLSQALERLKIKQQNDYSKKIESYYLLLDDCSQQLSKESLLKIKNSQTKLLEVHGFLQAINPDRVLQRGYSYLNYGGQLVSDYKSFNQVKKGQELEIVFSDGKAKVAKC